MKKFFIMCSLLLATALGVAAQGKISIQDINSGVFAAKKVGGMRALPDGETYSRISDDGTKIIACYYKNGQQASVLFDINNTVGEKVKAFDDYIISRHKNAHQDRDKDGISQVFNCKILCV